MDRPLSIREAVIGNCLTSTDISHKTRFFYENRARVLAEAFGIHGVESVADLKAEHFGAVRADLAKRYKPSSLDLLGRSIRDLAVLSGQPDSHNPFNGNRLPLNPITQDEMKKILDEAKKLPTLRDAVMIKMISTTGANTTELVGVNKADVSLPTETGLVSVTYTDVRLGQDPRVNALDDEGSDLIQRHVETIQNPDSPILKSSRGRSAGQRLSRQGLWSIIGSYGTVIERDITPRDIRDFYIMNFTGTADDLKSALGISLGAAARLMSRRTHTTRRV